jgi:hypothetical protein
MKYFDHQSDPVARCSSKRREPDRLSCLTAGSALDKRTRAVPAQMQVG